MADRNPDRPHDRPTALCSLMHRLNLYAPNSAQLIGLLALFVTASILLLMSGITVVALVTGLIVFAPLIIITSPVWVPIGAALFVLASGLLLAVGSVAAVAWLYRYLSGMHPPGSNRVDYARSRVYDTAAHVKDYARGYGGYWQSRVKDAAPGA